MNKHTAIIFIPNSFVWLKAKYGEIQKKYLVLSICLLWRLQHWSDISGSMNIAYVYLSLVTACQSLFNNHEPKLFSIQKCIFIILDWWTLYYFKEINLSNRWDPNNYSQSHQNGSGCNSKKGTRGIMVIVIGNGHGDMSSNPGRNWLHFTLH